MELLISVGILLLSAVAAALNPTVPDAVWLYDNVKGVHCPKTRFPTYIKSSEGENYFIQCSRGISSLFRCPNERKFDFDTKKCGIDRSFIEYFDNDLCLNNYDSYVSSPKGGRYYISCLGERPTEKMCDVGEFFNFENNECSTEPFMDSVCPGDPSLLYFPSPNGKNYYIACLDGDLVELRCEEWKTFNFDLKKCIDPYQNQVQRNAIITNKAINDNEDNYLRNDINDYEQTDRSLDLAWLKGLLADETLLSGDQGNYKFNKEESNDYNKKIEVADWNRVEDDSDWKDDSNDLAPREEDSTTLVSEEESSDSAWLKGPLADETLFSGDQGNYKFNKEESNDNNKKLKVTDWNRVEDVSDWKDDSNDLLSREDDSKNLVSEEESSEDIEKLLKEIEEEDSEDQGLLEDESQSLQVSETVVVINLFLNDDKNMMADEPKQKSQDQKWIYELFNILNLWTNITVKGLCKISGC